MKISQRVLGLLRGHEIMTDGQTNRQTDGQTDGQGDYYRAPPASSGGALIRNGAFGKTRARETYEPRRKTKASIKSACRIKVYSMRCLLLKYLQLLLTQTRCL